MKYLTIKNAAIFAVGGLVFLALDKRGIIPGFLKF